MWINWIWLILLGVWMVFYFSRFQRGLEVNRKRLAAAWGLSVLVSAAICCCEGSAAQAVTLISLAFFLPVIAVIDYENRIIPNWLLLQLAAAGIFGYIVLFLTESREDFLYKLSSRCLTGLGLFAALLLVALLSKGLGGGDVKLFGLIGCMCGYTISISILFWSLVCSMLAAVVLLAQRKKGKKDTLPFGPFILAGYLISVAALYL